MYSSTIASPMTTTRRSFIFETVFSDPAGEKLAFMKEVESTVGIKRIKVWHLNDSKKELGSRVDRHEHIGHGTIGLEGFKPIVRDKAFANVPKILETAKAKDEAGRDWDAVNLETLKSLM